MHINAGNKNKRNQKYLTWILFGSFGGATVGVIIASTACPGSIAVIILSGTSGCVLFCAGSIVIVNFITPSTTKISVRIKNYTHIPTVDSIIFNIRENCMQKGKKTDFAFDAVYKIIEGENLRPELYFEREDDRYCIFFPYININQTQYCMFNEAMTYFFAAFIIRRIFQQIDQEMSNNIEAMEFARQITYIHMPIMVEEVKLIYGMFGFRYPLVY
ncbi:MAG: hypothetical protein AB1333_04855 [Patescibacteria group bacterium]